MLPVNPSSLPENVEKYLCRKQREIDRHSGYLEKVTAGKRKWKNKSADYFGKEGGVRDTLARSCTGLERCHYCEDSKADEIEHFRPKGVYPESVFVWENFLYVCGGCNGIKREQFAIRELDGVVTHIKKGRPEEPPDGLPMLIDPRRENPLLFLDLDFYTGRFKPRRGLKNEESERAEYTIQTLELNRDELQEARESKYRFFLSRIKECHHFPPEADRGTEWRLLKNDILKSPHRCVWEMMKEFADEVPELSTLFARYPELHSIG